MKKSVFLVFSMILVLVLVVGCYGGYNAQQQPAQQQSPPVAAPQQTTEPAATAAPQTSSTIDVAIKDFAFNPQAVTVKAGDTVRWTNQDFTSHTVSSDIFESPTLAKDGTYDYKFDKKGTFEYKCGIHASMKGTIIVE